MLARQLRKHNVQCEITLIEQAPEFKNIGYGIALWANWRRILKEAGIDDTSIDQEGYEVPWEVFETPQHRLLNQVLLSHVKALGVPVFIPRALLHRTIVSQIDQNIVHLNTKPVAIQNNVANKTVNVEFSNGTRSEYDLVVGADGIHSWTRENIFGPGYLKNYGWSIWVMWIDSKFKLSKGAVGISVPGKLATLFPLRERSMLSLTALKKPGPDNVEQRKESLLETFKEFGEPITGIIESVPSGQEILYNDCMYVQLNHWYKNRIVLIGDAQHALSPAMGMGASLALEDACVLADELSKTGDIDGALANFSQRRNLRLEPYKKAAHRIESVMMASGFMNQLRNIFLPFIPGSYFLKPLERLGSEEI